MDQLKSKLKAIIRSQYGLPGLSRSEYLIAIRSTIDSQLPEVDRLKLKRLDIDKTIMEISEEIADETL